MTDFDSPGSGDTALEALRHLCELVHHPTQRRLERALALDWAPFPPIARIVGDDPSQVTPTLVGVRMRGFLEQACDELAPSHPSTAESLSGIGVVRLHLLEGLSWDAITAERMEMGVPVSARTLRTHLESYVVVRLAPSQQ